MRDAEFETDPWFHTMGVVRVRQDLVDPQPSPAATDEPMRDTDEGDVSVQLDPVGQIARVTIRHPNPEAPSEA